MKNIPKLFSRKYLASCGASSLLFFILLPTSLPVAPSPLIQLIIVILIPTLEVSIFSFLFNFNNKNCKILGYKIPLLILYTQPEFVLSLIITFFTTSRLFPNAIDNPSMYPHGDPLIFLIFVFSVTHILLRYVGVRLLFSKHPVRNTLIGTLILFLLSFFAPLFVLFPPVPEL